MEINKSSLILKYSAPGDISYEGPRQKKIGKIRCAGCGEWIRSNDDLSDVELVVTKRGSLVVFHADCAEQVWKTKIQ